MNDIGACVSCSDFPVRVDSGGLCDGCRKAYDSRVQRLLAGASKYNPPVKERPFAPHVHNDLEMTDGA